MNKNLIYLIFIGLIGLLSNCKKDETKIVMSSNPIVPTIQTLPDLTLVRDNGLDTLIFIGTPVDPGFNASATYFLEADTVGNDFKDAVVIYSGVQDTLIKLTVSEVNGALLKRFPANKVSSVDYRIRALLVVDAGTGAPGTSADPFIYNSITENVTTTIYGLPRLDLVGSGLDNIVESALGNGKYKGYVKLDATKPFTLHDPDANITYGAAGSGVLAVNGSTLTPAANGWYDMSANTVDLTYKMDAYMIGLVGSATSNGWNSPDTKMDYNSKAGVWYITTNLVDGEIKFRLNDGWAWNLGGTPEKLTQGGANIPVKAGNYTIKLTIINGTTGTCTIVKN